jgi:hypothetical protein
MVYARVAVSLVSLLARLPPQVHAITTARLRSTVTLCCVSVQLVYEFAIRS